jgi:iron complex outermembrane receptor protein
LQVVLSVAPLAEQVRVVPPIVDTTVTDAFGSVSAVVSAAQVEQLNAIDLASALRRTPGVTISRFNPVGAFGGEAGGAVFVRGMGASRPGGELKTYVDGVPFYMGIWNHPLLDLLQDSSLEQVRVHKGPQPQLFGNTFSAIDLATRRGRRAGLEGTVRVSAGAFATFIEQADVAGRAGRWEYAAAQGFARSDGHREAADGRLANAFGRLGFHPSPRWSVIGTVLGADNDAGDPGVEGRPETRTGRFGTSGVLATLTVAHAHERATGSVQVYGNAGDGDWRGQPAPDGDTRTTFALAGLRWREQATWLGAYLSGGVDVDRIDGSVQFDRVAPAPSAHFDADALTVTAPHVALDRVFDIGHGWSVQPSAGVRAYAHSVFDSAAAPHAGVIVRGLGMLALRGRYARGVNYPGQEVVALSALIPPLRDSWRALRPETADHVETGASVTPSAATSVDVSWFRDAVENRYVFGFPPAVAPPAFVNLAGYTLRGVEMSLQQRVAARWEAFAALTVLDASMPDLPYVPDQTLVAGVTGVAGPFRIAADLQHQSEMHVLARARSAGAANTERVDGFTVVNLRPSWLLPRLDGRVEVFLAIENLFDESYGYRPGYPMPGTSAQVGVTFRARSH